MLDEIDGDSDFEAITTNTQNPPHGWRFDLTDDHEDDYRGAILMVAPGVDYDPAEDRPCIPDGLPGDPDDAEDGHDAEAHADDDFGVDDQGEPGSWPDDKLGGAPVAYADDDHEEDGEDIHQRRRRIRENRRA